MGKILDALTNKRAGASPANSTPASVNDAGDDKGRGWLSYLTHAAFVAFCAAMTLAVYSLGIYYGLPQAYCVLVAGGCAAGLFGHGSAVTRPTTNTSRTMHGLALGTWLVLSLFLAALYMFISSDELSRFLPPDMITVGAVIYSLTFAIGLFTSVIALVVPSVAERKINDGEHATLGAAVSKYGETVAIVIAIAVSSFHIFMFGQNVAKLDMFSVITATVMADLAFLTAEKRVVSEMRSRAATGRYDRFDLIAWGVFGLAVISYLILVNLFTVRHSAGVLNEQDPLFKATLDFYGASPSILLFMLALLSLITALVDSKVGESSAAGTAPKVRVTRPIAGRAADAIRGTRAGIAEVKQAWRENQPVQLPAGTTLAVEGVDDGWKMHQSGDLVWFDKRFPNGTSATVRSRIGEPNATWKAWDVRDGGLDGSIAQGEAGLIGLCKADAERAALAYQPADEHNADAPKRSEAGVPYDMTGEVAHEDWPTDEERRRVLAELQRRMGGAEAKK